MFDILYKGTKDLGLQWHGHKLLNIAAPRAGPFSVSVLYVRFTGGETASHTLLRKHLRYFPRMFPMLTEVRWVAERKQRTAEQGLLQNWYVLVFTYTKTRASRKLIFTEQLQAGNNPTLQGLLVFYIDKKKTEKKT